MSRTIKSLATATAIVAGLLSSTASARSVFDDIRNAAPKSVFDEIRDTAPRSNIVFDTLKGNAP